MPNLGMGELLVLLMILVLVFGAARLPQLGAGIGKAVQNLKRGVKSNDDIEVHPTATRSEAEPDVPSEKNQEIEDAQVIDP